MDLQTLWARMYPKFDDFDDLQKNKIKTILFCELGNFNIEEKERCKDIVQYDDDMKGYTMFFVAKKVEGLSEKSLKYYKIVIDTLLKKVPKKLSQYTTDDMRYYLALREMNDKVSPTTADNERRILNGFFEWLSSEDYISKNICSPIKQIKQPKRKKKAFTEIEIAKIKDTCQNLNIDIYRKRAIALVEFLLSTGCRVNEICTLKKENLDLDARTAVVFGKGSKERTVYLNQVAKLRLQEYFNLRKDNSEYVFCGCRKPYSKMNTGVLEKLIKEIGEKSGIKDCHPHKFRRTTATMAIKKGMSLIDVQRMLGHENLETTKIYLDLDDTALRYQHEKFM
ncbi:MAG: tyrosine-type recombinase/integrase [Ruminococcus sp.]